MSAMKLKILAVVEVTKSVMIEDTKPDKRFAVGYRKLGTKSPRLAVDISLIIEWDHSIRSGQIMFISQFGKMRVTRIDDTGSGAVHLRNIEWKLVENHTLCFKANEYIDVLPLG